MNTNRNFHFVVILALVAILLQSFTTQASAAQPSDPGGVTASASNFDCEEVLRNAPAILARIDVPKTRAEYAALDRIAKCLVVAGVSITIPVTGRPASTADRFMAVKDLQAELADKSGYTRSPEVATGYMDKHFAEFKIRQAERMGR